MKQRKKNTGFDCMAFKEHAQKRLYRATRGMTWSEETEYYNQKALNGPFSDIARLYKPVRTKVAKASESPSKYK